MIRLLLADDEDLIRTALASLLDLEDDLQVVAQAATTTDAIAQARQHRPDIAILDLEMPQPTDCTPPRPSAPNYPPASRWSPATPAPAYCAAP